MKLGILGAGGIASTMAKTVAGMKDVEAYAVAARDLERARVFAQKYEVKKAYGSYEEMLADDEVELVYIATPHSHHYLHAKMCLEAGKHVLCEKAFTVNVEQAQKLFDLAKEKKLLITEAIWTRYMPSRKMINDIIESVRKDERYNNAMQYSDKQNARDESDRAAHEAVLNSMQSGLELFREVQNNPSFRKWLFDSAFNSTYQTNSQQHP